MNWTNQTIWTGDNLPIMRGMNSASVDLIYLDPPFNSKANYAAPIGSKAAGSEFKDTWTLQDVDVAWLDLIEQKHPALNRVIHAAMSAGDKSYLIYMAVRLLEMKRILKGTGSIYLHCDPTMSHYLKIVMDAIFGRANFRNEIVWQRSLAHNMKTRGFQRVNDTILFYSTTETFRFNTVYTPFGPAQLKRYRMDDNGRMFTGQDLTFSSTVVSKQFDWRGTRPPPNRSWGASREQLETWYAEGRILLKKDGTPRLDGKKVYLDEKPGKPTTTSWADISRIGNTAKERVGYPTQKPLALLERIIKASSNEGDVVLDPFCGCATTCIAAEKMARQWAGIDISPKAVDLVRSRARRELTHAVMSGAEIFEAIARTDIPKRTDLGDIPRYNRKENRTELYGTQKGHCAGCRDHFQDRHLEVDHIISRNKGGTDHIENLQLLCGHCNRVKGNRGMEYLIAKLAA